MVQDSLLDDMERVQGIWDDELSSIVEINKVDVFYSNNQYFTYLLSLEFWLVHMGDVKAGS